jgi:hypothetical protein
MKSKFVLILLGVLLYAWVALAGVNSIKHPLNEKLAGVEGPYTQTMIQILKDWPKDRPAYKKEMTLPVQIDAIEDPNPKKKYAIGLIQSMMIHAPIAEVNRILQDFSNYKKLFFTFEDVKLMEQDGNRAITFWETHIPIPFIPNSKYTMWYVWNDQSPERAMYRYQLKESKDLYYSDGLIVLESVGPNKKDTQYSEYDFWDADWGLATTFAPGRIWGDSLEGIFLSDIAIKLKAEHPEWDYSKIKHDSEELLDHYPKDEILKNKKRFQKAK